LNVRLLVTRPEPDAQRTAATLRANGHEVVIAPLMRIETIADTDLGTGPWAAIVVTSANAAHAIAQHAGVAALRAVPVFAVGKRSAQAMVAAEFANVASADGNAGDLARHVAARVKPGDRLLYLAGEERYGDLTGDLGARGCTVHTAVVYRAVAATLLPPAAAQALLHLDGVLHFSRRSAEAYVSAARDAGMLARALRPTHFCLSAQVAEPLARAGAVAIHVAPQPAEAELIELIGSG
jgi:uroporphyrinogen-III synthase